MSRLLYPDRLELGLVPALRALLGRIPASVATQLVVSDPVRVLDDPESGSLTVSERLLAVRVVEEGITNSLKHGPAASVRAPLDVATGSCTSASRMTGSLRRRVRGRPLRHRPARHQAVLDRGPT